MRGRILYSKPVSAILAVTVVVGTLTLAVFMTVPITFSGSSNNATQPRPPIVADRSLLNEIEALLLDYSKALSSGQVVQGNYTPVMRELVQERRAFYKEYFEIGLHSTLNSVQSEFIVGLDGIEISALPNDQLRVKVTERVILSGKYQSSPEEAA